MNEDIPFEASDRRLTLWDYQGDRHALLLRNVGEKGMPNLDVRAERVRYISLLTSMRGFEFVEPTEAEIERLKSILPDLDAASAKVICSEEKRHILVGENFAMSRNDWQHYESPFQQFMRPPLFSQDGFEPVERLAPPDKFFLVTNITDESVPATIPARFVQRLDCSWAPDCFLVEADLPTFGNQWIVSPRHIGIMFDTESWPLTVRISKILDAEPVNEGRAPSVAVEPLCIAKLFQTEAEAQAFASRHVRKKP